MRLLLLLLVGLVSVDTLTWWEQVWSTASVSVWQHMKLSQQSYSRPLRRKRHGRLVKQLVNIVSYKESVVYVHVSESVDGLESQTWLSLTDRKFQFWLLCCEMIWEIYFQQSTRKVCTVVLATVSLYDFVPFLVAGNAVVLEFLLLDFDRKHHCAWCLVQSQHRYLCFHIKIKDFTLIGLSMTVIS